MTRLLILLSLLALVACDETKPTDKQEATKHLNEDRPGHAVCEEGYMLLDVSGTDAKYCIPYKLPMKE